MLQPFEFLENFRFSILSISIYHRPQSYTWVKHLWSFELPRAFVFTFERLDTLLAWIRHPSENLWPFKFLESIRCSISSVWIYYAAESDVRVISYDHLNFSRASVVQFWASRLSWAWVIHPNPKLWPFYFSWAFLFKFKCLDIWWPLIIHTSQKLWPFQFALRFYV